MEDLIKTLESMDVSNNEQKQAIAIVIQLIKYNEVNPRQISIDEHQQLSIFD